MIKKLQALAFIITLIPMFADAQSFYALRRNRNLLVSAGSGTAHYFGEMVDPGEIGPTRVNIAFGAEYYYTSRISLRAQLTWFQLYGTDTRANDDREERNLHFRSGNIELDALGAFNLSPIGQRFYQRSQFNLHVFGGIGLLYTNPRAKIDDKWHALQPLQTEGVKYSRFQPVIPVGIGARIRLDPFFNLLIEGGYRITFTDYLDDVSIRRYPDPTTLKGGPGSLTARLSDRRPEIGTQPANPTQVGVRGNPGQNDGYFVTSITIQYYWPTEIFQTSQRKLYNTKRKSYYRRPRAR